MEVRAVIDRFEGEWGVVLLGEREVVLNIPRNLLPAGAIEGSVLKVEFRLDAEASEVQREKVKDMLRRLSGKE